VRNYISHIKEVDPETKRPYSLRYIGSMVSDLHRTLLLGGIFLYPPNVSNPQGKLRLMYECNPMGYIIEQAGGLAVDGERRVLDISPESIHQTAPVYMGSRENVEKLLEFLESAG
jgi:fructose-1,6-bisphosphatase I